MRRWRDLKETTMRRVSARVIVAISEEYEYYSVFVISSIGRGVITWFGCYWLYVYFQYYVTLCFLNGIFK